MVVARLAIMEAVISKAMLNTIALKVALTSSRAGALQTATCFALRLILNIAMLDDSKVALALLVGQHRHLDLRLDRLVGDDVEEIGLALLQLEATGYFGHILAAQIGMDRASTKFALSYALDDGLGTH